MPFRFVAFGPRLALLGAARKQQQRRCASLVVAVAVASPPPLLPPRRMTAAHAAIRNFASSAATALPRTTAPTPPPPPPPPRDRALSAAAKYLRITALIAGVYGLGYQMGTMDAVSNPKKKEASVMEAVCQSAGCSDPSSQTSRTRMTSDGSLVQSSALLSRDPELHRVASVGRRIVRVAREVAREARAKEIEDIKSELPASVLMQATDPDAVVQQIADYNESVLFRDPLAAAASVMEDGEWTYVLLDSPAPNAFVTSVLPRKIFVTTSMMDKLVKNDDEMAMVLGHEVSHLLLGHVKNRTVAEAVLGTIELLVLTTLSAAGGIGTLQAMSVLATVKRWFSNAYSRESEHEADAMGIRLAAMAQYDTSLGIEVFRKMEALDPPGVKFLAFELDHPPTKERYEFLKQASEEENAEKYKRRTSPFREE